MWLVPHVNGRIESDGCQVTFELRIVGVIGGKHDTVVTGEQDGGGHS